MDFASDVPPLAELIVALEHATLMAKQLPTTTESSQVIHVYSSLQNTQHQISAFLARFQSSQPQTGEDSVSSAIQEGEPMLVGEDEDEAEAETHVGEENSTSIVNKVEERFRECFLQKKRRKRPLSPTSEKEEPSTDDRLICGTPLFDPLGTLLRSLDLVFQFHG